MEQGPEALGDHTQMTSCCFVAGTAGWVAPKSNPRMSSDCDSMNTCFAISLLRLVSATTVALLAALFVPVYSRMSRHAIEFANQEVIGLTPLNEQLVARGELALLCPLLLLLTGLFVLRFRRHWTVVFEGIVQVAWLFALVWSGLCLLSWQIQSVPTMSGGRWHL
jgi:hypothetical protein